MRTSGEEEILEALRKLGGKASRGTLYRSVQQMGHTDEPSSLTRDFHRLVTSLLAVQDIVIMPDGEYQINDRVVA